MGRHLFFSLSPQYVLQRTCKSLHPPHLNFYSWRLTGCGLLSESFAFCYVSELCPQSHIFLPTKWCHASYQGMDWAAFPWGVNQHLSVCPLQGLCHPSLIPFSPCWDPDTAPSDFRDVTVRVYVTTGLDGGWGWSEGTASLVLVFSNVLSRLWIPDPHPWIACLMQPWSFLPKNKAGVLLP